MKRKGPEAVTRRDFVKVTGTAAAGLGARFVLDWLFPETALAGGERSLSGVEVVKPSKEVLFDEAPREVRTWYPVTPDRILTPEQTNTNYPIAIFSGKITERPASLENVPQYIPGAETPFKTALVLDPAKNPRYLPLKQTYRTDKESEGYDFWTTYCNIFAKDMAINDGHPIPWAYGGYKMDAKTIDNWIKSEMAAELGWKGTNSIEIAQNKASSSKLVIVTFHSFENDGMDGHVAVLMPSKERVTDMFEATVAQAGMLCGFLKLKDGFNGLINHRLYRADAAKRLTFSWCEGEPYHFVRKV